MSALVRAEGQRRMHGVYRQLTSRGVVFPPLYERIDSRHSSSLLTGVTGAPMTKLRPPPSTHRVLGTWKGYDWPRGSFDF
jgi:hypothetical protein